MFQNFVRKFATKPSRFSSDTLLEIPRKMTLADINPSKMPTDPSEMHKAIPLTLLREYCRVNGLPISGNKKALIRRVRKSWGLDSESRTSHASISAEGYFFLGRSSGLTQIANLTDTTISKRDLRLIIKGQSVNVEKALEIITASAVCFIQFI